jgi:hypothetical protein
MSCVAPLTAYHHYESIDKGDTPAFKFFPKLKLCQFPYSEVGQEFIDDLEITFGFETEVFKTRTRKVVLPCSRCIGCKMDRVRDWSLRCWHESQMHDENSFITLTYDEPSLPLVRTKHGDLVPTLRQSHLQCFMKRLRRSLGKKRVRFFACGEYGAKLGRPHFHILLFGYDFKDKKLIRSSNDPDKRLYFSKHLAQLWPSGFSSVGSVTPASTAYVSRYVIKKMHGYAAHSHYGVDKIVRKRWREFDYELDKKMMHKVRLREDTDKDPDKPGRFYHIRMLPDHVFFVQKPEFCVSSNRQAIGHAWISQFKDDCYPSDFVVNAEGFKNRPPRYYDRFLQLTNPKLFDIVKQARLARRSDICPRRLQAKKEILEQRVSKLSGEF